MKVTIEFDSEEEQAALLNEVSRLKLESKEQIEQILSEHLAAALRSPFIRRELRFLQVKKNG